MVEPVTSRNMLTVEEYLKLEESATVRREYVGGVIHAMVGTTKRHNSIAGNIYRRLADRAANGICRVYIESVKVRADEDTIYYPDVMVACGPEDDDPLIEHQSCLIVEVTSPSTESIDRREKAFTYRKIQA